MEKLKIGFCPTRRDCFSREEAWKYRDLIRDSLRGYDVELVDLAGINEEALLCRQDDPEKVIDRFTTEKVDALFFPHCNFGSEALVSRVARAMHLPTLLWGPRDDRPNSDGIRSRDSQCGLFATGKVMRRYNVPFTYLTNSRLDSPQFHRGFEKFLAVARVVKAFRNLRILQISTRPEPFSSVICNENELLEQFDIHLYPVTLTEIVAEMNRIRDEDGKAYHEVISNIREKDATAPEEGIRLTAALMLAVEHYADYFRCAAVAVQCWSALQMEIGIMPCLANALLTEAGLPVACETDIHGAISAVMLRAAMGVGAVPFFADITVRHPTNDNAELLWHCGNFPPCLAKNQEKVSFASNPYMADQNFGIVQNELKDGELTIVRFDGDHGNYSLLLGEAVTTDGPMNKGSYVWIQTGNWPMWEHRLVEGPYIHHVSGGYGRCADILMEACKYIPGLTADPVEPTWEELVTRWW